MHSLSTILKPLQSWAARVLETLRVQVESKRGGPSSDESRHDHGLSPAPRARSRPWDSAPDTVDDTRRLRVSVLGPLRVAFRDRSVERWPSRKGKLLFAHLAMNHSKRVSRDALKEMFWPRSAPRSARNCLNVTIHGVRQLLRTVEDEHSILLYEGERYFINPSVHIWLDVDDFNRAWSEGRRRERQRRVQEALDLYAEAASVYGGDLMEDCPYEDWLDLEREHLKEVYLQILGKISRYYSLDGDPEGAIGLCEKMLEKDGCQEDVYRRLMLCYYRLGHRDRALKQYRRCARAMDREFGVAPSRETERLYEGIRQQQPADGLQRVGSPLGRDGKA